MALSRSRAAIHTILGLVGHVVRFVTEAARSHAQLAAENVFLRKQLSKGEGPDQGPRTGVMLIWNDPLSSPDLSMVAAFLVSVIMIPISALWDMIAFRHIPDLRSLDRSDA